MQNSRCYQTTTIHLHHHQHHHHNPHHRREDKMDWVCATVFNLLGWHLISLLLLNNCNNSNDITTVDRQRESGWTTRRSTQINGSRKTATNQYHPLQSPKIVNHLKPQRTSWLEVNAFVCSVCRIFIGGSTTHKIKINQN